jgi:hypothetical protein
MRTADIKAQNRWLISLSLVCPVAIVGALAFAASRPIDVAISPTALIVRGSFGVTIPAGDIERISLEQQMPRIVRKRIGIDGFRAWRGRFVLDNGREAYLYVNPPRAPYIRVQTHRTLVYMNGSDPDRTKSLFNRLQALDPSRQARE